MVEEMKNKKIEEKKEDPISEKKEIQTEKTNEANVQDSAKDTVEIGKSKEGTKEDVKQKTAKIIKGDKKTVIKKEEAIARGVSMHMSKKQGVYISRFIKNKKIDQAIDDLNQVIKMKKVVPFKGEIPHRKGKGMMSGRYPVKASGFVIKVLKGLKGNVITNGMDLENSVIYYASASWAARPQRRGGMLAKRTNMIIKAKEITEKKKNG
ncbi:hypothetical protein COU60_00585 [Candidatus Pacearchaeota archaeon CG10_big_fil_rev_8_21_14_0_10_34_76]|nr:MAG: hypothetical protein COU60_00585 [Candidatus Pacearchaeota archaeon CG10_big_fil_rev_8_21_14_0_10_34_76]